MITCAHCINSVLNDAPRDVWTKHQYVYAVWAIHHARLLEIVAKCNLVGDVMHAVSGRAAGRRCQFNLWTTYFRAGSGRRDGGLGRAGRMNTYQ